MQRAREHFSSLPTLTAQWRVFGLMAVAFARQILRMERSGARGGALAKAGMLELWLHAALARLSGQISVAQQSKANTHLTQRLQAIAFALVCLALFVARVKQRLRAQLSSVTAKAHRITKRDRAGVAPLVRPIQEMEYIDTS